MRVSLGLTFGLVDLAITLGAGCGSSSGHTGTAGTGGANEVTCRPACTADQDCIDGSCVASPWGGMSCTTSQDCQSWATCCDGSSESCDGTRLPAGDGTHSGEFVVNADRLTVTDTITGLVWQRDGSGVRSGCSGTGNLTCTWAEAKAYCEGLVLGGLSGWRLPARHELLTIVDFNRVSPSIDSDVFPTAFPANSSFDTWTSSPFALACANMYPGDLSRWYVDFYTGSTGVDVSNKYGVRCVRGSRCYPTSRFLVLDGGLVRDTLTSLVWQQQESPTRMDWAAAQSYCSAAGSGFRLPTVRELNSIVDLTVTCGTTIDLAAFPGTVMGTFWTSSPCAAGSSPTGSSGIAWNVDFNNGASDNCYWGMDRDSWVRCVR